MQKNKLTHTIPQTRIDEDTKNAIVKISLELDREQQELVRMAVKMLADKYRRGQWPEKGKRRHSLREEM